MKEKILNSIKKLEKWVEDHNYKSYEPFDGLASYLKPLTLNIRLLERILQQIVLRSSINIRPLIGVRPKESTKGRGYMAWGYLYLYKNLKNKNYENKAKMLLDWLDTNKSPFYKYHSWGNHFPFSGRGVRLKPLEPIIVWTSLIGQAYLEAYDIFGNNKYLDIPRSITNWILELPREKTESGSCISYVAYEQSSIHNSNMLGAAMLARTAKYTKNNKAMTVAKEAMEYSCSRQLSDGSWYYGEEKKYHWIDNFHTGYNLDSLKCYIENTGDKDYEENLKKGFEFFKNNFFEKNGKCKYYHNKTYPVDSQCIAQSIDTLALFSDNDKEELDLCFKVTNWAIDNMQDKDGHFYYRALPNMKIKTPMLHWAQATMYKALSLLLFRING